MVVGIQGQLHPGQLLGAGLVGVEDAGAQGAVTGPELHIAVAGAGACLGLVALGIVDMIQVKNHLIQGIQIIVSLVHLLLGLGIFQNGLGGLQRSGELILQGIFHPFQVQSLSLVTQLLQVAGVHSQGISGNQDNLIDDRLHIAPLQLDLIDSAEVVGVEGLEGGVQGANLHPGTAVDGLSQVGRCHRRRLAPDIHPGIADGAAALEDVNLLQVGHIGQLVDNGAGETAFHVGLEAGGEVAVNHVLRQVLAGNLRRVCHEGGVGVGGDILSVVDEDFAQVNPAVTVGLGNPHPQVPGIHRDFHLAHIGAEVGIGAAGFAPAHGTGGGVVPLVGGEVINVDDSGPLTVQGFCHFNDTLTDVVELAVLNQGFQLPDAPGLAQVKDDGAAGILDTGKDGIGIHIPVKPFPGLTGLLGIAAVLRVAQAGDAVELNAGGLVNHQLQLVQGEGDSLFGGVLQEHIPGIHGALGVGGSLVEGGTGLQGEGLSALGVQVDFPNLGNPGQLNAHILAGVQGDGNCLGQGGFLIGALAVSALTCGFGVGIQVGNGLGLRVEGGNRDFGELDPGTYLLIVHHTDVPGFHAAQVHFHHIGAGIVAGKGLDHGPAVRSGHVGGFCVGVFQMVLLPLVGTGVADDEADGIHLDGLAQVHAQVVTHHAVVGVHIAASVRVKPDEGAVAAVQQVIQAALVDGPQGGVDDLGGVLHIGEHLEFAELTPVGLPGVVHQADIPGAGAFQIHIHDVLAGGLAGNLGKVVPGFPVLGVGHMEILPLVSAAVAYHDPDSADFLDTAQIQADVVTGDGGILVGTAVERSVPDHGAVVAVGELGLRAGVNGVAGGLLNGTGEVLGSFLLGRQLVNQNLPDANPLGVVCGSGEPQAPDAGEAQTLQNQLGIAGKVQVILAGHHLPGLAVGGVLQLTGGEGVRHVAGTAGEEGGLVHINGTAEGQAHIVPGLDYPAGNGLGLQVAVIHAGKLGAIGEAVAEAPEGGDNQLGGVHTGLSQNRHMVPDGAQERHDMLHAYLSVLVVVQIPEGVGVGPLQSRLGLGVVIGHSAGFLVNVVGLEGLQQMLCRLGNIRPGVQPVDNLVPNPGVALGLINLSRILELLEIRQHRGDVTGGEGSGIHLFLEGGKLRCQHHRLLQSGDTTIHVLVDHVLGQLPQSLGSGGVLIAVVIHILERIRPCLVSLFLGPDVPAVAGVAEDGNLGGLRLLHGVQDDALNLLGGHTGVQEGGVAAHNQVLLGVVGAGPVNPHVGAPLHIAVESVGEAVGNLAPHPAAGHDDGYFHGHPAHPALAVAAVLHRAEGDGGLEAGVLLLHFVGADPLHQVSHQADIQVVALVAGIVCQHGNLPHAGTHDLLKLRLQNLDGLLVVGGGNGVGHEGMQGKDELALGLVAGGSQRCNLGSQLLVGVELTPLGVVLGVVLGGVEVGIELVVAAPAHQLRPILGGPGVAVVAFDEATGGHICPVVHRQVPHLAVLYLLHNLLQGGQAVEGRIGGAAQHANLVVLHHQQIAVGFGKNIGVHSAEEGIGISFGVVNLHGEACFLPGSGSRQRNAGLTQGILGSCLGIGVDAVPVVNRQGFRQGADTLPIGQLLGDGIELILRRGGVGRLSLRKHCQRHCSNEHHQCQQSCQGFFQIHKYFLLFLGGFSPKSPRFLLRPHLTFLENGPL